MDASSIGDLLRNHGESRRGPSREDLSPRDPRRRQKIERQIKPARTGVKRHRAQQSGERPGATNMPRRRARARAAAQPAALDIILERREIGRRLVVEVTFAAVDQAVDLGAFEAAGGDRGGKRLGDVVLRRLAVVNRGDRVTPPLQADHAEHRL